MDITMGQLTRENEMIKMTENEFIDKSESFNGICLSCKEETYGSIDIDTHCEKCEACGSNRVCSYEQALILGLVEFVEVDEV